MKKMMMTLIAMLTMTVSANAMSFEQARNEALFLTDKMAYELNLTDEQYEAAYEINLDYLMGVTGRADVFGTYWERRNLDLSYILYDWQWQAYIAASYFYRPLYWEAGYWHFGIYARYPHRDYFFFGRPAFYATYRGGHAWHVHGGHGYYYGHREHFRAPRDRHVGMHDRFDRGEFRNHRNSSTRITGSPDRGGRRVENNRGGRVENNRGGRVENRQGTFGGSRRDDGRTTAPNRNDNNKPERTTTAPNRNENTTPNRSVNSTPNRSSNTTPNRSGNSTPSRKINATPSRSENRTLMNGNSTPSRVTNSNGNFGGSRSSASPSQSSSAPRSSTRSNASPSRSVSPSHSSSSPSRSVSPTRSSSSSHSSGASRSSSGGSRGGGGGHFGGRR